jgi:uncharacterized protein (TIGR01777 family)
MKIVIPGGSGFVGQYCIPKFRQQGYEIIVISRSARPHDNGVRIISWQDESAILGAINGADLVLNLAGRSVDCRYNDKNKAEILSSRVDTTRAIGEAIAKCDVPPPVWLNASTATIYRDAKDRAMTESSGEIGTGFSVEVGKAWEAAFNDRDLPATRRAALRISIALGDEGGFMGPAKMLVRLGLGGRHGSGRQMFSWIHVEDLYRAIEFIWKNDAISGPVILAAPEAVSNDEFMRALRRAMGMPIGLPAAKWMLEIGAFALRTETELLLKSRWVYPEKLLAAGFTFQYPTVEAALRELLDAS